MVRLRLLALFQGLLCLTAASPAQKRSIQDDDYALVRDVARQFFSDRGSTVARKAQEKEELSIDQNVREYKNPMFDVGQEDDNSDDSFPVVEDRLTPDTVEKIGEDFLPFEFPFKAKETETSKLSFEPEEKKTGNLLPAEEENVAPDIVEEDDGEVDEEDILRFFLSLGSPHMFKNETGERNQKVGTAQQEILTGNGIRQDGDHAQKEIGDEKDFAEEVKDGETNLEEVEGKVSGGDVEEIEDTKEDSQKVVAGRHNGEGGSEKEAVGIGEQDEKPNDMPLNFVGISRTEVWYPPVYGDNEQEEGQQDLVDGEVSDYNDTICGLDELGRELFVMSILMRRISGMFLDEILKAERNESAPAEEEIREDVPKNAGVLVKEEELPTVNKDRVADEIGSPKEEVGPSQEVKFPNHKDSPSYYRSFVPNQVRVPEDKENVYENNENMANAVIYPVKQEAYADTFEHFMSKMDAGHEDPFYHQTDKRPSGSEDNFNHQGDKRTGHEDIFKPQANKMRPGYEDTFYHQMDKRPSGSEDTFNHQGDKRTGHKDIFKPQTNKMRPGYEDPFYHQMDKRPSGSEDNFNHQGDKVRARDGDIFEPQTNKMRPGYEDTFYHQMEERPSGHEDIFDHQTGKAFAGHKDGRGDLEEEKDSKQEMEESGEYLGVQDFLTFLGNLLVGEDGESMPESGERKPVDDLTKLKSRAGDIGSSDAEAEELDEARERALKLDRI